MAQTTEKILRLRVEGDTAGAQAALNKVNAALVGTTASATSLQTVLNNATGKYEHTIDIAASKLAELKRLSSSLGTSLGGSGTVTTNLVNQNLIAEAQARRYKLNAIFRQETNDATAELNRRVALETSIIANGANHIKTIEIQAAQEEVRIRKNLAAQLEAIERQIATQSNFRNAQGGFISRDAARTAAINQATAASQQQLIANNVRLAETQRLHNESVATGTERHTNLATRVFELIGLYRIFNSVINTVVNSIKAIPQIGIELDATRSSLIATTGGIAGATATLKFLDEEAERTGLAIGALRQNFRTFQASTSLAGESMETTINIFKDINTVSTALHLTTDKTQSVFLALAQIFNKSKVQSEELVKQLGNLLPGAFASFAAANKDLFKDIPDLVSKMKQGVVTAHDTVENFANYLANRFKDSFDVAADSLNANIGRMQTSFSHLGEAIYGVTSGPMNSFVKGLASVADAITEDIKGSNLLGQSLTFLKEIFIAVAAVMAGRYLASLHAIIQAHFVATGAITASAKATQLFNSALAFLRSPAAIIGGLALLGQAFLDVRSKVEETGKAIDDAYAKFTRHQAAVTKGQKLNIEIEESSSVVEAKKLLEDTEKRIKELKTVRGESEIARKLTGLIADNELEVQEGRALKQALLLEKARYNAKAQLQAQDLAQNATVIEESEQAKYDTHITYLRLQHDADSAAKVAELEFDKQHAKARNSFEKAIKAGEAKDATEAQKIASAEALQSKLESDKSRELTIQQARESFSQKTGATARKESKDLYKDLNRDAQESSKVIGDSLKQLEYDYKSNLVSIASYFQQKKELQLKDLEGQLEAADNAKGLAQQTNDLAKVQEYEDKVQDLIRKTQEVQADGDREKFEALEDYNKKLQEIQANALEASGDTLGANVIRIKAKYLEDEKLLRINTNEEALKQLGISKQLELSQVNINKLTRDEDNASKQLQATEARINIDKQSHVISQKQAQVALVKAREDYVKLEDEIIAKLERELELNQGNVEIADKINDAKTKRNSVAYSGIGFNQQFIQGEGSLGKTFEDTQGQIKLDKNQSLKKIEDDALSSYKDKMEQRKQVDLDYVNASAKNHMNLYQGIATVGSEAFMGLTEAAQKMYGAQSKQARAAFVAYKATKVAEVTMATAKAVMEALAAGPFIGPVLAGLAGAMGAVQIATIASQPLPQAHAGLTSAPTNQTFNISKGERVVAPQQNRDLTKALAEGSLSGKQGNSSPNIRIINAVDPGLFNEYLGGAEGEKVIMNIVKRNNG